MQPGRVPFAAWPSEPAAWFALLAALAPMALLLVLRPRRPVHVPRTWLVALALLATALSGLYVHFYLRGGPRIIDATSYFLEARAMAHGMLTWPVPEPTASFRGRFLLARWTADGAVAGVIFPPGYPALLALGFLAGAPMAVGPVIAALLVLATAALARAVSHRDDVAVIAAVMSVLCAALRYHTADTMSHGAAALALTSALAFAFLARDTPPGRYRIALLAAAGLAVGWLAATRPFSAAAVVLAGSPFLAFARQRRSWLDLAWIAAGAVAPLALLAAHQLATTGHLLASSQRAYYAVADGPPGCFRYGFGRGIGCLVEHGTYVRDLLPDGYGLAQAVRVTARRLVLHVEDVLNLPMAVVLVPLGAWVARTNRRARALAAVVLAVILAYVPFYFDGDYPGAGARMFAEAIPAEHVLAALAMCWWCDRLRTPARLAWGLGVTATAMLLGFAIFNAPKHAALRDRDGGRPFFEPAIVRAAGASHGLLFVDSDHGFATAYDPAVRTPADGLVVARARHDDHDRLLWERLGRPSAWSYRWKPWEPSPAPPAVEPWSALAGTPDRWVFESEADWPPVAQRGGYAAPTWLAPASCVSAGIALALIRTADPEACVTIEVPMPAPGPWMVAPWLVVYGEAEVRAWLDDGPSRVSYDVPARLAPSSWAGARASVADGRWCVPLPPLRVEAKARARRLLTVCSRARWAALDKVDVSRPAAGDR